MIRRPPTSIIQAAIMDPERRDLYVEGVHDKMVLEFLCGSARNQNVRVLVVDEALDLAHAGGGSKGRLLILAKAAEQRNVQNLRFLVDRDLDPFVGATVPGNTWRTDVPDFEGYLLSESSLSKVLRISYCDAEMDASSLLSCVVAMCRQIGLLRVLSRRTHLDLSVTKTGKAKYVVSKHGSVTFDFDRFVTTLLQEASISLSKKGEVLSALETIAEEFVETPSTQLIRGKDFMELSVIVLRRRGINSKEFPRILWATLERSIAREHPTLSTVVAFLTGRIEQEN